MKQNKQNQMARRQMARVMDELYTALFQAGAVKVEMSVERLEEGYRLRMTADYDPRHRAQVERLEALLRPEERNPALVEAYWELAGGDQYSGDSELALVGHMLDEASVYVGEGSVSLELLICHH